MKLKDVTFVEQHVEKLVLLAAVLALLAVVYFYVVQTPYTVKIGGKELAPVNVSAHVHGDAQRLASQLAKKEPAKELEEFKIPEYVTMFDQSVTSPLIEQTELAVLGGNRPSEQAIDFIPKRYPEPKVPAPSITSVRPELVTVVDAEVEKNAALKNILTASGVAAAPFDIRAVSVRGTFDMAALRASITRQEMPIDNFKQISAREIDTKFGIVDIVIERREKLADGTWSTTIEEVPQHPNASATRQINNPVETAQIQGHLVTVLKNQSSITRPVFPEIRGSGQWKPPTDGAAPAPEPAKEEANDAAAPAQPVEPKSKSILYEDSVDFWSVDFTAKPGKTYQYRAKMVVTNPLYALSGTMSEEQRVEQINKFIIDRGAAPWSEWSKEVTTRPAYYLKFVNASQNAKGGSATIKIFKYYDGAWREAEFRRVSEGDLIGGPAEISIGGKTVSVDFSTGSYVIHLDRFKVPGGFSGVRETPVMMYFADGQFKYRWVNKDREDPTIQQIEKEIAEGAAGADQKRAAAAR